MIVSPLEGHSIKPNIVRDKIVMGDLPRIELFARQCTAGWDVWGNEMENSLSLNEKAIDITFAFMIRFVS